ncbi:hypothetical protein C8F01DRAFT_1102906 [Mycena amicta]|nr:hypothetical protein C8F01DRAFT_1102906 [Mycena amicta]
MLPSHLRSAQPYLPTWSPMAPGVDPTDYRAFYPYTPNEVKHRKRTTSAQLKVLEGIFKRDTKPNAGLRTELAAQLNMTARGVQVWFQNRRAKEKNKTAKALKKDAESSSRSSEDGEQCESPSEAVPSLSSSLSPSPTTMSPPQLHVVTDSSSLGSPVIETCDDELPSLHSLRRGSLPLAYGPPLVDPLDPLARRRSVDASLARFSQNPYVARAKNSSLLATQRLSQGRQQPRMYMRPGMPHRSTVPIQHTRHSSMDARGYRIPQSPSPSPLSPFHIQPSRNISAPIPGPLPNPGFSFGVANASTSSSEHNSPVDFSGFSFPRNDTDTEDEGSIYQISRFGSIASESSTTSAYFSDIGSNAESPDFRRRESCPTGFLNLMSGLDVNAPRRASLAEGLLGGYSTSDTAERDAQAVGYPSPCSTVSAGSSPHLAGHSSSSELNYALKHQEVSYRPRSAETGESSTFFYDTNTANSYPPPTADSNVEFSHYDFGMTTYPAEGDVEGTGMAPFHNNNMEFNGPTERYYESRPVGDTSFTYS